MDTQRLISLVVFALSSLMLWEAWQRHNAPKPPATPVTATAPAGVPQPTTALTPPTAATSPSGTQSAVPAAPTGVAPAAGGEAVTVKTDLFDVELNTLGGDIRRVTMNQVYSALDRSQRLTLMEPDPKHYYVTQSGLLGEGLPTHKTAYDTGARSYALAPNQETLEVRLTARDAGGADVVKKYRFRRGSYVIDVSYEIANRTDKPLPAHAYFQFLRDANPPSEQAAQTNAFAGVTTFTGPALYTEAVKFEKVKFDDISTGKQAHAKKATDGWIGVIQHYFVSAWLPRQGLEREFFTSKVGDNLYTAGVVVPVGSIAPGASASVEVPVYIGPQETEKLKKVAPGLELVVDYGWLTIIAAPLFWLLNWIHTLVGNWGWAIIVLTILIKAVFYPLNAKAGRSMAQMKVMAPKMEKLKQLYGDDRQKLNQAMMELYKTEKINPLGGCFPILVQIPVFIALYWVLLAAIELRHAPFMLWITDLSALDPYYVLPILMATTMVLQTRMNPVPPDPVQAKVMQFMPYVFSVFFFFFPAGLVLYWLVNNILSILQQWQIQRMFQRDKPAHAKR